MLHSCGKRTVGVVALLTVGWVALSIPCSGNDGAARLDPRENCVYWTSENHDRKPDSPVSRYCQVTEDGDPVPAGNDEPRVKWPLVRRLTSALANVLLDPLGMAQFLSTPDDARRTD